MLIAEPFKKYWRKIINANWNIAIAEIGEDLSPVNIRWIKHNYTDRWFADPFFLEITSDAYVILAEEFIISSGLGRICRLVIGKKDYELIQNDTLLELSTHLSFPNSFIHEGNTYIYPENSAAGQLTIYRMTEHNLEYKTMLPIPLIDPVLFFNNEKGVFLLGTLPENAKGNSNILHVYKSDHLWGKYKETQQIPFKDNVARRAGKIFQWKGKIISPAQICNNHYGEGISLQEIKCSEDGTLNMQEIQRLEAKQITKMTGFHTYNVFGENVVIDGYQYGNEFIHDTYFKIRGFKNM